MNLRRHTRNNLKRTPFKYDDFASDEEIENALKIKKNSKRRRPYQTIYNPDDEEDEEYNLNRIFRKSVRKPLPNVTIGVDLHKLSLIDFISDMKAFDLIHCSVPLSMLYTMP